MSVPSFMLMHWGRDRHRGPRLPLELLVKRQTSETAAFSACVTAARSRRVCALINLIDFDRMRLHQPELVNDLPAGGRLSCSASTAIRPH